MFALLELGKEVKAYTIHIEGLENQDFIYAKENCSKFNVDFQEVIMPKKVDVEKVVRIIKLYNRKKKTDIECIYPFLYLLEAMKEEILITGSASDGHFCISKKGMIHYKHTLKKTQEYRRNLFLGDNDYAQTKCLKEIGSRAYSTIIDTPYIKESIYNYFYTKTWKQVNKPFQKHHLIEMFPDKFCRIKLFKHTNLQCGDSQIREMFEPMLKDKKLNKKKRTRMIDLYRDIYNGI